MTDFLSVSNHQLALDVKLEDEPTFANYYLAESSANLQAVSQLVDFIQGGMSEPVVFLWGSASVGITHLLKASCQLATALGLKARYIPLAEMQSQAPESLFDLCSELDICCIDDLDVIAGKREWEQVVFHVYNRLRDGGKQMILAAHTSPSLLDLCLPDLKSRLAYGVTYHIKPLTDEEKVYALQLHAEQLGLQLNEETAWFVVNRVSRDLNALFVALNRLDHASLAQQRKLTIPFVKQVLEL
ncbi:DnaA regulatory inactivator Hda [Sessilibacter corallicola]|nr:DnaA regulatory inactivator Hda [Sessilibacter corallicola]MCE2026849.1 DnaA regulatory inactivator Hda [Sessilibacter corallicola]